jgi:ATP-dependent protease HslVU (ClpYQ) peptidase subunit
MTCIVGIVQNNEVWLGGDRAMTHSGLQQDLIKEPKIFVKNHIGFGVCGLPKVMDIIKYVVELPDNVEGIVGKTFLVSKVVPAIRDCLKQHDSTITFDDGQIGFNGSILVGYDGHLYTMECNFQLTESERNFMAIGSGAEPAIGSLMTTRSCRSPHKRILQALKTSADNNAGVRAPFDVIKLSSNKQ